MGTLRPLKGQPGKFIDTVTGAVYDISEMREGDKYDTIVIDDGVVAAGAEYYFFRDVQRKRLVDTNFTQQSRLSAGEQVIVNRIGAQIALAGGNVLPWPRDIKKVAENAFLRIEVNQLLQAEGKLVTFNSGYGLSGMTQETDQGILGIGVPSTAAAAKLLRTQLLTDKHEVLGYLRFYDRNWLATYSSYYDENPADRMPTLENPVLVTCYLHGLIKSAVSK